MKQLIIITFFFCAGLVSAQKLVAPAYPGAKKISDNGYATFITNDSYDQVKAFYASDLGTAPESEETKDKQGKKGFFVYQQYTVGDEKGFKGDIAEVKIGVTVENKMANNVNVNRVLGMFTTKREQQVLSVEEHNRIMNRYGHLSSYYFLPEHDPTTNRTTCKSRIIYDKYNELHKKAQEKDDKSMEKTADAAMQLQQLVAEGRITETTQLAQQFKADAEALQKKDFHDMTIWEECLKEFEKYIYQTNIIIEKTRQ